MSPREKAFSIYNSFYGIPLYIKNVKECCYKVIDEIIESRKDDPAFDDTMWENASEYYKPNPMYLNYWLKVREEIKNL